MLGIWIAGLCVALAQEPSADDGLVALESLPVVKVVQSASAPPLHLVYTGGSMGIGSGSYAFEQSDRIAAQAQNLKVTPVHGMFVQDGLVLIAADGRVATLVSLLDGGDVTCAEPTATTGVFTDRERVIVPESAEGPPPWLAELPGVGIQLVSRTCTAPNGASARLIGTTAGPQAPAAWTLDAFESRLGLHLTDETGNTLAHIVGVPDNEGARRFGVLLEKVSGENTIYVDSGSFVDGASSVRNGALSLHRPLGFEMLKRLDPKALAPGATELAGGPRIFLEEAAKYGLPYVATNWKTEDPGLAMSPLEVVVAPDGQRIAFLGLLDPAIHLDVPALAVEGVQITDPVEAALATVALLAQQDEPPDLIVGLTTAGPALLQRLQSEVPGLDLVIGDIGTRADALNSLDIAFKPQVRGGWVLPADGISTVTITQGDRRLSRAQVTAVQVQVDDAPDPTVLARVTAVRAAEYPEHDHVLLAASDPALATAAIDHETWSKVVCESVREFTNADAVFLPPLPEGAPIPGSLTELLAVDRLAMLDTLEIHRIPGDRLDRLLQKVYGLPIVHCGATPGDRFAKARGRFIEADRLYRVVSTDRGRLSSVLGPILATEYSGYLLDQPGFKPVLTGKGDAKKPVTLRKAVITVLRDDMTEENGLSLPSFTELYTVRGPGDKPPMWLLRMRRLSIRIERFQGANNDAFAEMSETRATSPSTLTIGTDLDAALEYSGRAVNTDLRLRALYTRLSSEADPNQETADDIKVSSSLSIPAAGFPKNGFGLMPFGEVLYDTEFTAVESDDGTEIPHQHDLSLSLGLAARRWSFIRELRLSGFANRDMARLTEKSTEFGAQLDAETLVKFGPGVRFTTLWTGRVYGDTPQDDAADMRFHLFGETRFALPLARWLNIAVFGQGYVFQGRIPETSDVGFSWTLGFAFDLVGAFEL